MILAFTRPARLTARRGALFRVDDALRRAIGLDPLHIPHQAEVKGARAVAIGLLYLNQNTLEYHRPVVGVMYCGLDFKRDAFTSSALTMVTLLSTRATSGQPGIKNTRPTRGLSDMFR